MSRRIVVDDRFRKQWAEGVSSRDMAERLGCSYPTINRLAKRAGLPPRGRRDPPPGRSEDEAVLDWLALRSMGAGFREIARHVGRAEQTVHDACRAVRSADLAESGEPAAAVAAGYW